MTIAKLLTVGVLLLSLNATAATVSFTTVLSGANENPANASPGTGNALVVFNDTAHTMFISIDFSGLLSPTTASHIHCCAAPPANAPVATQTPRFVGFPTGATAGHYENTFDLTATSSFNASFVTAHGGTAASAEEALIAGAVAGQAYLNIHSDRFPGGEIRGFLVATPEPGTFVIAGAALGALAFLRRRVA